MIKNFICVVMLWLGFAAASQADSFHNPVLWADVPDPDVIRVNDDFYMVSTTMHLMPGAPIMHSKDLVNWKTIGYIFPKLTDSPKYDMQNGTVYGRGQWATSLKYHKGKFYALFAPNDNPGGESYICTAENPAGPWTTVSRLRHFHDATLFFDDDDRVYIIYGTGQMVELSEDLKTVIEGSERQIMYRDETETGLLEGSRMIKHDGKYYLLMISWPKTGRREVCYRYNMLGGDYEKKVIIETDFGGFPKVGQGTIVDSKDGKWWGIIFQDRGGVGRVLTLEPCNWIDGWPILGDENGKIPEVMEKPVQGYDGGHIVSSDDFDSETLNLDWQWNHNPIDTAWSLKDRPGFLRLKTSRIAKNVFMAPNTISQRMEGPKCSAEVKMDISHMVDGDVAGFSAFQNLAATLSVKMINGKKFIEAATPEMLLEHTHKTVTGVLDKTLSMKRLNADEVYFKIEADFNPGQDLANLYYSTNGTDWTLLIENFKMKYDWQRMFMGTRLAIFNYATQSNGGYVDVDYFHYNKETQK